MVSVSFDGLDDLLRTVKNLESKLVTKAVNKEAAEIVKETADTLVPVRSGRLKRTGRTSGTKAAGVVRYGKAAVPYAGPAHFGHYGRSQGGFMRPQPWLYDAADLRGAEVVANYEQFVAKVLAQEF